MHAMWTGFALAVLIAVIGGVVVVEFGDSSTERYSMNSVRL